MIVHDFSPVLIDLGIFQVKWYSIAYILGITIGWVYALKIIEKTSKDKYSFEQIQKEQFDDLIIYLVLELF